MSEPVDHRIEVHLDKLLADRGITLVELSTQVGVTVANLSILKNGHARAVRFSTLTAICDALDQREPRNDGKSYKEQITYVPDRPGHDQRYAIDASKISSELDWEPLETFESGITRTVGWYLENRQWWGQILQATTAAQRRGLGG